jgi:hypothetical protein
MNRSGAVPSRHPTKEMAVKRMFLISIAAALVVAPATGDAAISKRGRSCPDGALCIWSKKNYRGDREVFEKKGATNVSKELNNEATSVKNRTGDDTYLMDAKNGSTNDDYQCVFEPEFPDLGEIGWNNVTSSVLRPKPGDLGPDC